MRKGIQARIWTSYLCLKPPKPYQLNYPRRTWQANNSRRNLMTMASILIYESVTQNKSQIMEMSIDDEHIIIFIKLQEKTWMRIRDYTSISKVLFFPRHFLRKTWWNKLWLFMSKYVPAFSWSYITCALWISSWWTWLMMRTIFL